MIQSENKQGTCDITGEDNIPIYDTEEDCYLSDYFVEILDIYTPKSRLPHDFPDYLLSPLSKKLYDDWRIFDTEISDVVSIMRALCKDDYEEDNPLFSEPVGIKKLCDSSFLERHCLLKSHSWDEFKSSIKNINRFHSNHINLNLLETILESDSIQKKYKSGSLCLYRGRVSDKIGFDKHNMGAPPDDLATPGRANSRGIGCLYLANNIETTLHELRVRDFDYVSVAIFEQKKDLRIVDLAALDKISPFSNTDFDSEWFAINMKILNQISSEIAKPLRRQDSELDYLPAQYISDFVKSLGYDGICYKSTLYEDGVNFAIFSKEKFKCKNVDVYYVKSIKPEYEKV